MKKLSKIIDIAYQQNSDDQKFPIFGTCLGFEAIVHTFGNYRLKRIYINTENQNKKIEWTDNYRGSFFEDVLRQEVAEEMSNTPISYFAQHYGFTTRAMRLNRAIDSGFNVIGFYRKWGKKIVSAIEHRRFPIVGVQFHPEKVLFEHKIKVHTKLTRLSAMASQELARILFENALENRNRFRSADELERLELKSFTTRKSMSVFESVYLFNPRYFSGRLLRKQARLEKKK